MVIEKSNYFTRKFESALLDIPKEDRALVDALITPLEPTTAFFRNQRKEGFYGGLTIDDDLPIGGDSPYKIIRSNGEYTAYNYAQIEPYKKYLSEIARRMEYGIEMALKTNDPERDLFEATLRPIARALWQGKFAEAMISGLNTRHTPRYHLFVGFLDRYLDPRGFHLVMQGWLQRVNPEKNRFFNELVRQITGSSIPRFRIIYGDMLAAGGMTVDKPWSGNTVPSEDDIRNQVGSNIYVFSNNMDESTKNEDIPAVRKYVPQVTQIPGWEEIVYKAKKIAITAHEIGHAEMPFDGETIKLLDGRYMAIKELLAELFEVAEIAKLPRSIVSPNMKRFIFARSLARWRYYVDEFYQEDDSNKKAILEHYAWAGVWRTNYQERRGGLRMNENGTMKVSDWDEFVNLDRNLYQELLSAINNERYQNGFVDAVIQLNSRSPRVYIEDNHNHHPLSPQTVTA